MLLNKTYPGTLTLVSPIEHRVVHPIFDLPEEKLTPKGPIKMTRGTKISLVFLRIYLLAMVVMAIYRTLQLANVLK